MTVLAAALPPSMPAIVVLSRQLSQSGSGVVVPPSPTLTAAVRLWLLRGERRRRRWRRGLVPHFLFRARGRGGGGGGSVDRSVGLSEPASSSSSSRGKKGARTGFSHPRREAAAAAFISTAAAMEPESVIEDKTIELMVSVRDSRRGRAGTHSSPPPPREWGREGWAEETPQGGGGRRRERGKGRRRRGGSWSL